MDLMWLCCSILILVVEGYNFTLVWYKCCVTGSNNVELTATTSFNKVSSFLETRLYAL